MISAAGTPQLNPFAFLSDTRLRFVLLLVLAVFGTAKQWYSIGFELTEMDRKVTDCFGARSVGVQDLVSSPSPEVISCFASMSMGGQAAFLVFGLMLLALVTLVIWLCYPRAIVWRARLVPFDRRRLPQIAATLDRLCETAELDEQPSFWWNPLDGRPGMARAFGRKGHRRIALSMGLVFQCLKEPDTFETVLLHELGHLRNKDITASYLALSVAWGFVATALLPNLLVALSHHPDAANLLLTLGEVGSFALCLTLTRAAVLRSRELYADIRVSSWQPDQSRHGDAFRSLTVVPAWRRWLSSHPDPVKRQRLLTSTDEMFVPSAGEAFGIGASAGIICVFSVAFFLRPTSTFNPAVILIPLLVSMPLAAGAISIGIWRSAFLSLMRGKVRAPIGRIAFSTALGAVGGFTFIPLLGSLLSASGFGGADPTILKLGEIGPGMLFAVFALFIVLATVVLTIALAFNLAWVEATAWYWMRASLFGSCPRKLAVVVCIVSAIATTAWVIAMPIFSLSLVTVRPDLPTADPIAYFWLLWVAPTASPTAAAVTWGAILTLWALPLSARLWPARTDVAPWALLGEQLAPSMATRPPARLRTVVGAGLIAGLLAVLMVLWIGQPLPVDPRRLQGVNPLFLWSHRWEVGIGVQALVASAVAICEPTAALPPALLAAFVAGTVFTASELLQFYVGAGYLHPMIAQFVCSYVILGGVTLAFVTVQATSMLITIVRGRQLRS